MLRRRSLARLRREVEPVEPAALGRFLPAWQGVGIVAGGVDRLLEVIGQLEGLALPASVLERDILPARVARLQPAAARRAAGVGGGGLGRHRLARPGRRPGRAVAGGPARLCGPARGAAARDGPPSRTPPTRPTRWLAGGSARRSWGTSRTAARPSIARSWRPSCGAAATTGARQPTQRELLDALWDLVWAGELTNDTFLPLRALRWPRSGRDRPAGATTDGRHRPGRSARGRRPVVARRGGGRDGGRPRRRHAAVGHGAAPRTGAAAARSPRRC